jgi:hypothetical protein
MPTGTTKSLGEALPIEMARVRDEVLPMHLEIGASGAFAAHAMRAALDDAAKAMISGDLVGMIAAYKSLQGFES